jgi:glycosyltransferase involved in cell wall biosynthesis
MTDCRSSLAAHDAGRRANASDPHQMSAFGEIGYLVSQYPATSHTFIRREVEAMRRQGIPVATFSVRPAPDAELRTAADRTSAAETDYILPLSVPKLLDAHLRALFTRPLSYARTFALALRHRVPGARALLWSVFHFAEAIQLARSLKQRDIAHLHNHFGNSGAVVGLLATRFMKLPWSLTLHGISETDYPAGLLLADKIEAAEFVACVSWFGRAQAMRLVRPEHWSKLQIVRCGIDMQAIDSQPLKHIGRDTGPLEIICVGRLSAEKGQTGLVEALAEVRRRSIDVRLTFVGDGPERATLGEAVAATGMDAHVAFAGRLDEMATLAAIRRADLLVLPSFMEGLPIVLMEAMACGVPVIAARVAGIPELVEHGVSGLLFTPGHWAELADGIERIARDPGLAAACAEQARIVIAREFDIDRAIAPLVERFAGPRLAVALSPILESRAG